MEDVLGLKNHREVWVTESYCLGDVTVRSRFTSNGDATPTTRYRIHVDTLSRQAIDNLNIHQLRDLRTLLNHILGEEGS